MTPRIFPAAVSTVGPSYFDESSTARAAAGTKPPKRALAATAPPPNKEDFMSARRPRSMFRKSFRLFHLVFLFMDQVPRSWRYNTLPSEYRNLVMQESLGCNQPNAQAHLSRLKSLLEIAEVQVVSRARDFAQFPVRPQLVIERGRPGLHQRFGVFHGDVELHVIVVHAAETLGDVELIAVRMAKAVEPSLVVKSDGIHDESRVPIPMPD